MNHMNIFGFGKRKRNQYITYEVYDPPWQHMIILKESLDLMEKTLNPGTYFSREKLASIKAEYCKNEPDIVWNGMNSAQINRMLYDQKELDNNHKRFIDRLFEAGREDSLAFQMHEVGLSLSGKMLHYYVWKLKRKEFHFCKVGFPGTDKLYTYITKDLSVKVGDSVTIPTGNSYVPDTKLKTVVEVFDAPLDSLEFPLYTLRCVEEKLKKITCPNCGASIEVDIGEKSGRCAYCNAFFYLL